MTHLRVSVLLALSACGVDSLRFARLEQPSDLVLPLLIDAAGEPVRVLPPFGAALAAESPQLLVTAPLRLVVITTDLDAIAAALSPWVVDPARLGTLGLTIGAPERTGISDDAATVLALPAAARLLIYEPDTSTLRALSADAEQALRSSLGLRVPVLDEACRIPGLETLTAFPVTGLPAAELKRVRIIDRDRMLVGMDEGVAFVERDQTWTGGPRQLVSYARSATEAVERATFDLSPISAPDGARLGAALVELREPAGYRLIDFRIHAGGVSWAATATLSASLGLVDLGFDHQGTLVVVGSDLIMTRDANERRLLIRTPGVIDQNLFAATGEDAAPHAVAGGVEVATGDARTGSWTAQIIPGLLLKVDQLAFDPLRRDAWMLADSLLFQRVEGSWVGRSELNYARRFTPCLDVGSGWPTKLNGIALSGDYFALVTDCSALLLGRRAPPLEECTTVLPQPDRAIEVRPAQELRAIDVQDGHLVTVGDRGWIFEAQLPAP